LRSREAGTRAIGNTGNEAAMRAQLPVGGLIAHIHQASCLLDKGEIKQPPQVYGTAPLDLPTSTALAEAVAKIAHLSDLRARPYMPVMPG
jgi:hypothetical protein